MEYKNCFEIKGISRRRIHAEKHGILREISFLGKRV